MLGRISFSTLVVLLVVLVTLFLSETVKAAPAKPPTHKTPTHKPSTHKPPTHKPKTSHKPTSKPSAGGAITLPQLTKAFTGHCPPKTTGEAITCKDALPYINAAIKKYGLKTKGQQAAYIANMAYEGVYLQYDHNTVTHSQGTRSIMPAISLRAFVDANKPVQKLFPGYPNIDNTKIVDVLIAHKLDFEPGAWWAVKGPGCAKVAAGLSGTSASFTAWEQGCINGGAGTVGARLNIFQSVYPAIA